MDFLNITTYLWLALAVLIVGSVYLIVEGYKVHKLFADSVVGKLVKTLVVVLLIELYSLGIVCYALLKFYPKGIVVLLPIVVLWLVGLAFAVIAVRSAGREVFRLIK